MQQPTTKKEMVDFLIEHGAYDVRVADPHKGFEHAVEGRHPLTILPTCRSVVVFIMPCPAWINNTVLGLYARSETPLKRWEVGAIKHAAYSPHHFMKIMKGVVYGQIWFAGAYFLAQRGYQVAYFMNRAARPQDKLCAFEAGLGVYGRSGLLLHPELGNRIAPGVLLTDAEFEPDGRLEGYAPCAKCGACVKVCPGQAFDPDKSYPGSFDNKKCQAARLKLAHENMYCHECLRVCPAAKIRDDEMAFLRRVYSYGENKRRQKKVPAGETAPLVEDITPA